MRTRPSRQFQKGRGSKPTCSSRSRVFSAFGAAKPRRALKEQSIRNDYDVGVLNGQTYTVLGVEAMLDGSYMLDLRDDDGADLTERVPAEDFTGNECRGFDHGRNRHKGMVCLTYGYAITAHKSQGSQWDDVLVIDERLTFKEPARWLYTAVTRAVEKVTVVTAPLDPITSEPGYWD